MNDEDDIKQQYIGQIWHVLQVYKDSFNTNTTIAVDFNWDVIWDTIFNFVLGLLDELNRDLIKS